MVALKRLESLPYIDTQTVIRMDRTFNRAGGYQHTFGYLYETSADKVYTDIKGPGVINRIWGTTTSKSISTGNGSKDQ